MVRRDLVVSTLLILGSCAFAAGTAAEEFWLSPADEAASAACAAPAAQAGGELFAEPADPIVDPMAERVLTSVQGPCTVTRQCNGSCSCQDVDISCSSGASGTCSSGTGGTCGGWVECDGVRTYCPTQVCKPCGGAPTCTKHIQCTSYCSPDPPWCSGGGSGGCCICI